MLENELHAEYSDIKAGKMDMSRRLHALVIGNGAYQNTTQLPNPVNDAEDLSCLLETCEFTVIQKTDCSQQDMDLALEKFQDVLKESDVALFFFAGHGVQIEGKNYLVGVDAKFKKEIDVKYSSLDLNKVIEVMEASNCETSIVILDACRNNPFARGRTISSTYERGLAPVYAPRGTLIAYATSPGKTASDGAGRNGEYTAALLQHLTTPDCSIETMFKRVRNTLSAATESRQISWEHTSLAGEFFFNLSLSLRIDIYDKKALSDNLFVLDEAKASHKVIRDLKSSDWYIQNKALQGFTPTLSNKATINSIFVLGRNIYQAACGKSHYAITYIDNFASLTSGIDPDKRKAMLDGMLFEVFFDSHAKLRQQFKLNSFAQLFSLQCHEDLLPSFDFIAQCLLPDVSRFHAIPGKRHEVAVDVKLKSAAGNGLLILESVTFCGKNILWLEDEDYSPETNEEPSYAKLDLKNFESRLAEQMVVPPHLLKINYTSRTRPEKDIIHFPRGRTVRKR